MKSLRQAKSAHYNMRNIFLHIQQKSPRVHARCRWPVRLYRKRRENKSGQADSLSLAVSTASRRTLNSDWYCLGVVPKCLENEPVKWLGLENPHS